jgi:hypothetical protein
MPQIKAFPNPDTGAYGLQQAAEFSAQTESRSGETSANPPSTNLPASVKLMSDAPPPIPSTGTVPFMNPVETPRAAELARVVNDAPPNMSVNLREDFINEAVGGQPLAPTVIATGGVGQEQTNGRPGASDAPLTGPNPVGSGPIISPDQPDVTLPIVGPGNPNE